MESRHQRNGLSLHTKPVTGLRVPLFDRLVDGAPDREKEHTPLRIYGRAAVLVSVARDLDRLMNTRRHLMQPSDIDLSPSELTIFDYGVPDFAWRSADDAEGRRIFGEILRTAILRFEPRLESPVIAFEPNPDNPRELLVAISGRVRLDSHAEPVTFSVVRQTGEGHYEVLAPEDPSTVQGNMLHG